MPSYVPRLRSVFQRGIQETFSESKGGFKDSLEVLIGQGSSGFTSCRLFHSSLFASLEDSQVLLHPGSVIAASSDSFLVNRRRNLSVVGVLSRPFSVPSVSGPAFQVCGYHIDLALLSNSKVSASEFQCKEMAACGSRNVVGEHNLGSLSSRRVQQSLLPNSGSIAYGDRGIDGCQKARMSLKNHQKPKTSTVSGYLMFDAAKKWYNSNSFLEYGQQKFHSSVPTCLPAGTAPDVSYDNSPREEHLGNASASSEGNIASGKTLKLCSASCYLPHPDKEETGGEDAHFICVDEQAIGVADGVGGWADLGVDSGLYSRELMSNSVTAVQEEPKGSVDPARVLEKAHSNTKSKGSSTACIIALTDQGVHAINLGDSGFIVVRDGCTVFRSPVQQHDFNFTYQLESGSNGDLPSSGQVFTVPVAPGDVIIAGTDGLFDNLYNNEITAVVVHAVRAGLGPQVTAQKIAALARQRAQDKDRQTPFSTAAQDAGFRYYGGKLDDITVVVSYVTSCSEESKS